MECAVCGRRNVPLARRTFHVMGYVFENEPICQECFELPTDEYSEPRPWVAEIQPGGEGA